jgi:ATP-dependent Clp protease ATP-binding subunit ClpX
VKERLGKKVVGFGADIGEMNKDKKAMTAAQPEDLLHYGLIPEFIGRLPVIGVLEELSEKDLVRILQEPKNALIKQYEKFFEFENVELRFTDGGLRAVAKKAMERKSGARGLRSIMETVMLDVMYDLPSIENVKQVVISEEVIAGEQAPIFLYEKASEKAS